MSKTKTIFQCQSCGFSSPKWVGKCPDCGSWNSFTEEQEVQVKKGMARPGSSEAMSLSDIPLNAEDRLSTGIEELNRVLGGGIVAGSLILIGGDPGIGKSTIVLQMLASLYKTNATMKNISLYVSGEESMKQIKIRAGRLNVDNPEINVLSETCLESITEQIKSLKPAVVIIDSIQTMFTQDAPSAPGSVTQVRECALKLMFLAKNSMTSIFLIGHVTKDGAIAGPRTLEHIVDTVLYFEGDRGNPYRILRAVKNRFGSTNEIGVFEMRDLGLVEITNPSELFLSERPEGASGTAVVSTIEGTRPIMVELQALVSHSNTAMPRRTAIGVETNRVNLLIAVLEKVGGVHLGGMDVFLNVVGGLKINEPAFDLGIITAIVSSFKEKPVRETLFVFGEVGLSGEIRGVSQAEGRIKEGTKIGFKEAIIPDSTLQRLTFKPDIKITGVKNIEEAIEAAINY
ncbi:MAG: DNA repair protein RadA [Nitrospirae bacterium]|nr:DNA repair protein RadA [Nitrospirota bacterium]MBF0533440.1 DNA repair protein RadA [Nitrospirota bacterium]MBF0616036.1 DNA repair protein RadA [Nitrospirota bacterium]